MFASHTIPVRLTASRSVNVCVRGTDLESALLGIVLQDLPDSDSIIDASSSRYDTLMGSKVAPGVWGRYSKGWGTNCAVTVDGWLIDAGAPAVMINAPPPGGSGYLPGNHFPKLISGAKSLGWYQEPAFGSLPIINPGDVYGIAHIDDNGQSAGTAHTGVVVSYTPSVDGQSAVVETAEGGQGSGGTIARNTRTFAVSHDGAHAVSVSPAGYSQSRGAPVTGWLTWWIAIGGPQQQVGSVRGTDGWVTTPFDPSLYGFRFRNAFADSYYLDVIHAPGLCGGMVYAALDAYNASQPVPTTRTTPSTHDPFGAYIKQRQEDSILGWQGVKFIGLISNPDDAALRAWSVGDEWDKLRRYIDAGKPMPIGLIAAPYRFLFNAANSHQALAYGYQETPDGKAILVWDPNVGESVLWLANGVAYWTSPSGQWRTFFVETDYTPQTPPNDIGVSGGMAVLQRTGAVASTNPTVEALGVVIDPDVQKDLSPPVAQIAQALDNGIGSAIGISGSLSSAGIGKLADVASQLSGDIADTVGDAASDIVSDLASAVPVVGAIVAAFIKILTLALGGGPSGQEQCQDLFAFYKAPQTGSILAGGPSVPADMFARAIDVSKQTASGLSAPGDYLPASVNSPLGGGSAVSLFAESITGNGMWPLKPGDNLFRSALGMALMQITEGYPIDPTDLTSRDWASPTGQQILNVHRLDIKGGSTNDTGKTYGEKFKPVRARQAFEQSVDDNYELMVNAWHQNADIPDSDVWAADSPYHKRRGLPKAWRERFRKLRRGIENQWKRRGDGGVGLWVIYIDLFVRAYERGYLSEPFVTYILQRMRDVSGVVRGENKWISTLPVFLWGDDPCPAMIADTINGEVLQWRDAVHPYYTEGQRSLASELSSLKPPKAEHAAPNHPEPRPSPIVASRKGRAGLWAAGGATLAAIAAGAYVVFRKTNRK